VRGRLEVLSTTSTTSTRSTPRDRSAWSDHPGKEGEGIGIAIKSNGRDLLAPGFCRKWFRYGSVKNGFDSAILTKIPRMKKKGLSGRQTTKYGAKRQARTLSQDHTTTGFYSF
jgi:hypothetical protein